MTRADLAIEDHGELALLVPLTGAARAWCDDHLAVRLLRCDGGVAVEVHIIARVIDSARDSGLTVRRRSSARFAESADRAVPGGVSTLQSNIPR